MIRTVKVTGINGNGGSNPSVVMPIGPEYMALLLRDTTGGVIGNFTNFQVNLNGVNYWPLSGQEIDEINKFDGLDAFATANILRLDFLNQKFIDGKSRQACTINTGVKDEMGKIITSFSIQWDQAAAITWEIKALIWDGDPLGPGLVKRFHKHNQDFTAATEDSLKNLQYGDPRHRNLRRAFLRPTAGNLSLVKLETGLGGKRRFERTPAENDQCILNGGKIKGAYWDFTMDLTENNMPDFLNTMEPDFYADPGKGGQGRIAGALDMKITNDANCSMAAVLEYQGLID